MQYLVRVLAEFWPRYRCFQISEGSRDNIIPLPLSSWYSTRSGAVNDVVANLTQTFHSRDWKRSITSRVAKIHHYVGRRDNSQTRRRPWVWGGWWWRASAGPLYPEVISKASPIFTQTLDVFVYPWATIKLVRDYLGFKVIARWLGTIGHAALITSSKGDVWHLHVFFSVHISHQCHCSLHLSWTIQKALTRKDSIEARLHHTEVLVGIMEREWYALWS